jgi:hypothetical protein
MEKEFVTYELALRMKQLGFNEPCFGMYQKNKKLWYCSKNNWITNFEVNPDSKTLDLHIKEYPKNVSLINGTYFLHSCSNFTAPTFSQAFRWFREKYELHSFIDCKWKNLGWEFQIVDLSKMETISSIDRYNHKTPEEAELECLIKLIEIVENEKML